MCIRDSPYNYRLPDFTGATGLERTFNETLRGSAGTKSLLVNNLGYRQREKIVVTPTPGNNVVLTLDLKIQEAAYKAIKETERKGAAAVVMNVQTGDIIALASLPVFDPNVFIPSIRSDLWNAYRESRPSPLRFRATQERYPPGSIFKIISGLAALEAGSNPTNFVYNPGYAKIGRRRMMTPHLRVITISAKASSIQATHILSRAPSRLVRNPSSPWETNFSCEKKPASSHGRKPSRNSRH